MCESQLLGKLMALFFLQFTSDCLLEKFGRSEGLDMNQTELTRMDANQSGGKIGHFQLFSAGNVQVTTCKLPATFEQNFIDGWGLKMPLSNLTFA